MRSLRGALLLVAGCAPSAQPVDRVGLHTWPEGLEMPSDVEEFIVQWEACQHWLGEPPWDEQRRRQIEQAVRDTCPGVDEHGRRIRARYADNSRIIAALREYEPLGQ